MSERPRRRFLKQSAALVTGMAATSCTPPNEAESDASATTLERSTLEAVARIVLPVAVVGEAGISSAVEGFSAWLSGFEAVAELDHPYLWTDEIAYGPADPAPLWGAQLDALEIEAQKRYGSRYVELDADRQLAVLKHQLPRGLASEMPYAGDAPHVAIGLVAYFYQTSEANDLGYQAAIEKQTCRGLDTSPDEPEPLS